MMGRPRKIRPENEALPTPVAISVPDEPTETPQAAPIAVKAPVQSLRGKLFERISALFEDAEVSVTPYPPGHSKLKNRAILEPHIGVKAKFSGFAVAGMIPANADEKAIEQLIARMQHDKRTYEDTMIPKVPT
jgi:hypothetical protein